MCPNSNCNVFRKVKLFQTLYFINFMKLFFFLASKMLVGLLKWSVLISHKISKFRKSYFSNDSDLKLKTCFPSAEDFLPTQVLSNFTPNKNSDSEEFYANHKQFLKALPSRNDRIKNKFWTQSIAKNYFTSSKKKNVYSLNMKNCL